MTTHAGSVQSAPPAPHGVMEQSPYAGDSTDASFRSVALTPVAWGGATDSAAADGAERRYSASPAARSMTKVRSARLAAARAAAAPDGHTPL